MKTQLHDQLMQNQHLDMDFVTSGVSDVFDAF